MAEVTRRFLRLIVNGKVAGDPALRAAVEQVRELGHRVDVRVTWEAGDAARYASEAVEDQADVAIAGGGDGTINEVANGILAASTMPSTAVGVIPYGTANDFATSCGILKGDPLKALQLAAESEATLIDVGKVNEHFFVNVASGGFGAEVTANTPVGMKKALGGAAYSIMGVVTAAKMSPFECRFELHDGTVHEGALLAMAVGNGLQCGGGYQVTPRAKLNDGLLDVMVIHDIEVAQLGTILSELLNLGAEENRFVAYAQVPSLKIESSQPSADEPGRRTHPRNTLSF